MEESSFFIPNRYGEKLDTVLRIPQKTGTFPAVLFVGGLGADLHEDFNSFDEISMRLVESVFATVQFTFAGLGKSEGKYEDMTFERQAKQIEDMLLWMNKQHHINPHRIGIIAQSCGAPSTLLAKTKDIQSIIFICGAFHAYENLQRMFVKRNAFNPTGISRYPRSNGSVTILNKGFWDCMISMDEDVLIKEKQMPVFLIGGEHDTYIMKKDIEQAFAQFPNPKKKLKIYEGGNHGMDDVTKKVRNEFLNDICEWIKETV
jgi:dienelactone hydrolase